MAMTSDAKRTLATTIRGLRTRLLHDLHSELKRTYRLDAPAADAGLDTSARIRRARLEEWVDEQVRARSTPKTTDKAKAALRTLVLGEVVHEAGSTWLNRLVFLRLLEGFGLRPELLLTGGFDSGAYKDLRELAPALVHADDTQGYRTLLTLVCDDLAIDLPGLFGDVGLTPLVPLPAATLRHAVEQLDQPELATCWSDDMTLGWVYQYWNDPAREALDDKLNKGGKVDNHEIASKTQMFTERYMVDWLLQNSLGPMWLATCAKHGWTPEVQSSGTLDDLEARRIDWRAQREAGTVSLTDLMPLHTAMEQRWAYYVPQPLPEDAVAQASDSVRDLKILDPAVGSGHFLIVAAELLLALYEEEARHRGLTHDPAWSRQATVEHILEHNLHGIDLDPRAVQIAAAALWLKAQTLAPGASPRTLQLVASNLRLASLPDADPSIQHLETQVHVETGIPARLTRTILHALAGADHLGSLLQVDTAVDEALKAAEQDLGELVGAQVPLFAELGGARRLPMSLDEAKASILGRLEAFLAKHGAADDLGLRLRGEQLAKGVRFARMVQPGRYDLVVANPPYQGTSKMKDSAYVTKHYPLGKADLYAAFLERGLQLVRPGGTSAMLTMRNWMFIKQYSGLREHLLSTYALRALGDFDRGAFEDIPDEVVSVAAVAFSSAGRGSDSTALCPTPREDTTRDAERTSRKRAATLCHVGRHTFDPVALQVVPEWPLVYWWDRTALERFHLSLSFGESAPAAKGLCTCNDVRYLRHGWEVAMAWERSWFPSIHGGKGINWIDPVDTLVRWKMEGAEIKVQQEADYGSVSKHVRSPHYYKRVGIAFSMIGGAFSARAHRRATIFGDKGSSLFPAEIAPALCSLNASESRQILQDLNPSISFQVGDVNRLPVIPIANAADIVAQLDTAFTTHESHREPSVEFLVPGPSPWTHAQAWAQLAVDRPEGDPLPPYTEVLEREPHTDHVSYALGVALGRFGAHGEGILDPATADLSGALDHGVLFLDGTDVADKDGLADPACHLLRQTWAERGARIDKKRDLRTWLADKFFGDIHRKMYDNRPIHWPLSSAKRTFVAWVNIHRMNADTLRVLESRWIAPVRARLEGQLHDLRSAKESGDTAQRNEAEKTFATLQAALTELVDFQRDVQQCAERGPLPPKPGVPPRDTDARFDPNLDDGVMINSAALWPLLAPQWKDPAKWWTELAKAEGRKDYDWSHLARRYWPERVDTKCQADPSLGVAHGCFWRYHPERAWAWELRLQDEIGPDFRITEGPYQPSPSEPADTGDGPYRQAILAQQPEAALEAVVKELKRRHKKHDAPVTRITLLDGDLWGEIPDQVWAAELELCAKWQANVRIEHPGSAALREAYAQAHPQLALERTRIVGAPQGALFGDSA